MIEERNQLRDAISGKQPNSIHFWLL